MELRLIMCSPTYQHLLCSSPCGVEISCGEAGQHCSFSPLKGAAGGAEQAGTLPSAQCQPPPTHTELHICINGDKLLFLLLEKVTTSSLNTAAAAGERTWERWQRIPAVLFTPTEVVRLSGKAEVFSSNTLYLFYLKFISSLLLKTVACSAFKI